MSEFIAENPIQVMRLARNLLGFDSKNLNSKFAKIVSKGSFLKHGIDENLQILTLANMLNFKIGLIEKQDQMVVQELLKNHAEYEERPELLLLYMTSFRHRKRVSQMMLNHAISFVETFFT